MVVADGIDVEDEPDKCASSAWYNVWVAKSTWEGTTVMWEWEWYHPMILVAVPSHAIGE